MIPLMKKMDEVRYLMSDGDRNSDIGLQTADLCSLLLEDGRRRLMMNKGNRQ